MATQKDGSGSCPDVLSELKISADRAFPEPGHPDKRKKYPRSLGLSDPTKLSAHAAKLFASYVVKSNGELKPRPERFCNLIADDKSSPHECYIKAGYHPGKHASQNSWLLRQKPEIAARIALLKTQRYRLAGARTSEVRAIIDDIDAGREPDIDHKVLLRQWAVNLDLARSVGDTQAANRALSNIQKLADYDTAMSKSKMTAIVHPQDRPDAEDGNHEAVADFLDGEITEGEHGERNSAPPTAAELAQVLLRAGSKD